MLPRPDDTELAATPTVRGGMRAWRVAHPRATFLQIEEEATRQVAALRATLIQDALDAREPGDGPERDAGPHDHHQPAGGGGGAGTPLSMSGLWGRAFPPG